MGRQFPTYIHYIEEEAKSKGEFIVRTVEPKLIARVNHLPSQGKPFQIEVLEFWDDALDRSQENRQKNYDIVLKHLQDWYFNRIWKQRHRTGRTPR